MFGSNNNKSKGAKCEHSTDKIVKSVILLGEEIADIKLHAYQIPFAKRIVTAFLNEDPCTITGLFARQCVYDQSLVEIDGDLPVYAREIKSGQTLKNFDKATLGTTEATAGAEPSNVYAFEVKLHNNATFICSEEHRSRSNGKWKKISDQSLCAGEGIDYYMSYLSGEEDNIQSFYAAQLLMFKQDWENELSTNLFTVKVPYKWAHTYAQLIPNLTLVDNGNYSSFTGKFKPEQIKKVLQGGFKNTWATMKYLMRNAELSFYRNNRKNVPRVTLETESSGYFFDLLVHFFKSHGMMPRIVGGTLYFEGFENLLRIEQFFDYHADYPDLKEYVYTYYQRKGFFVSAHGFLNVYRQNVPIKMFIKPSLLSHYRNVGIPLGTLLLYLKKIGKSEREIAHLMPAYVIAPIKSVVPVPNKNLVDIETLSGDYVADRIITHNSGKTESVSVVSDSMMVLLPFLQQKFPGDYRFSRFKNGLWIGIFAPSKEQSQTTYQRMKARLESSQGKSVLVRYKLKFKVANGNEVLITNGSLARSMTASDDANIESKTYHLIICEECQDISGFKIDKSILPMGTATSATNVFVGTANTKNSRFYNQIKNNKKKLLAGKEQNHFEVDYNEVCRINPRYKKSVAARIEEIGGTDTDEFRMSYMNEFIFERGMAFDEKMLDIWHPVDNKKGMYRVYLNLHPQYRGRNIISVGIDLGKNVDSTVLTAMEVDISNPIVLDYYVCYSKSIVGMYEMLGDNYNDQLPQIYSFIEQMRATTVVMDSTGKGEPIFDIVSAAFSHLDMVAFTYNSKSKDLLFKNYLNECRAGRILVPGSPQAKQTRIWKRFHQQHAILEKEYIGGYLVCRAPTDKQDGEEPHDDFPNSAALAAWGGKPEALAEVEQAENFLFETSSDRNGFLYQ